MAETTPNPQGSELSSELEDSSLLLADRRNDPTVWERRCLLVVDLKIPLEKELDFVGELAEQHSGNYLMWQHRRWIVEKLGSEAASKELEFTKKILSRDSKIYLAWSHRAWIIKKFGGSWWEAELQFCHDVLEKDIFNIFASDQRCRAIRSIPNMVGEFRDKEVSYARKAIQAQPWNESAWTYLKCLCVKDQSSLYKDDKLESIYVDVLYKEACRIEAAVEREGIDPLDNVVDRVVDKRGCLHALNLIVDLMFLGYKGSNRLSDAVNVLLERCDRSRSNVYHHWAEDTPEIFRNVCSLMLCLDAKRICFCNNYRGFNGFEYLRVKYLSGGNV